MKIEKGDKVQILKTGKEGEVIDEKIYDPMFPFSKPKIKVKFKDSVETEEIFQEKLVIVEKRPTKEEVIKAVGKIQEQILNIPSLRKREKEEIPTHLEYLLEDIQTSNTVYKKLDEVNLNFVKETLLALINTDSKANYSNDISNNLEKVNWWIGSR